MIHDVSCTSSTHCTSQLRRSLLWGCPNEICIVEPWCVDADFPSRQRDHDWWNVPCNSYVFLWERWLLLSVHCVGSCWGHLPILDHFRQWFAVSNPFCHHKYSLWSDLETGKKARRSNACFMVQCAGSEEIRSPHSLQALCSLIYYCCSMRWSLQRYTFWYVGSQWKSALRLFLRIFMLQYGIQGTSATCYVSWSPRDCTVQEAIVFSQPYFPRKMSCDL